MNSSEIAEVLAPIFEEQRWKWTSTLAADGIPTEEEISDFIDLLVNNCRSYRERYGDRTSNSSGRLRVIASYDGDEFEGYEVCLTFGLIDERAR